MLPLLLVTLRESESDSNVSSKKSSSSLMYEFALEASNSSDLRPERDGRLGHDGKAQLESRSRQLEPELISMGAVMALYEPYDPYMAACVCGVRVLVRRWSTI